MCAVCSAVQYVGTTDPTVLPIRKMPLVPVYDPLDNHNVVVCGIAPQCRVVWCVVCSACQGAENAGRRLAVKLAAHPPSPRTAQQSLASGASPLRLHHHLLAVRLVSRHFPPLHVALCRFGSRAAPTLSCPSALRRTIRSPIRAVRLRAEYRPSPVATVSTAPDASRHPCALGPPVALHLALSRCSS